MVRRDFEAVLSGLKYEGWLNTNSSLPTVFVADNGQGDVKAARMMRAHAAIPDGRAPQLGAFIHHVQPVPLSSSELQTSWESGVLGTERILAGQGIYLFRQYVHGACLAYKHGFISAEGYGRVAEDVIRECEPQPTELQLELLKASGLDYPRERTICSHFKPSFQIADGQWTPRPAEECDRPFADPAPGLMDGIRPKDIVAAGGEYITGFCSDLSMSLLDGLGQAQNLYDTHGGPEADPAELAEAGLPELLFWALKEGVHCLSDCNPLGWPSCDRQHANSAALLTARRCDTSGRCMSWDLEDSGKRTWSGFCRTRTSHICRLTPGP